MRNRLRALLLLFSVAFAIIASCGTDANKDSDECDEGTEGCPCYGNDTCNPGLECKSRLCVDLGTGGSGGSGGEPGSGCPSDREDCSGICADLASDEANCGRCGNGCGVGEECSAGECLCAAGREACDSVCVDTTSDPDHCGTCDMVCAAEEVCSVSACSDDCADGLTPCGRSCVDTSSSPDHCGACDAACGVEHTCTDGECVCPSGLTSCGESCVDTSDDSTHCGECDRACAGREECVAGECECATGSVRCGTACVAVGDCGTGGGGGMGGATGGSAGGGAAGRGGNGGGGTGGAGAGGGPSGPPIIELLVDNSSSMYEPRAELWDALYSALMDANDGAVAAFADRARIGFASFRGPDNIAVPETDPSCAQIETVGSVGPATVGPALDNRAAIDVVYRALGEQGRSAMSGVDAGLVSWETPTGHALKRVTDTLAAFNPNPAGRKYILLLTDGNPNTCLVGDPQCGQDLAVKAAQDARVRGITTLILGFGDVVTVNTGCTPSMMPCGEVHLQDMANAGTNLPVETPNANYWYIQCATAQSGTSPGIPVAAYVPAGSGGSAIYYRGTGRTELRTQLMAMFTRILDGAVP